jgi:hypothetical protein
MPVRSSYPIEELNKLVQEGFENAGLQVEIEIIEQLSQKFKTTSFWIEGLTHVKDVTRTIASIIKEEKLNPKVAIGSLQNKRYKLNLTLEKGLTS